MRPARAPLRRSRAATAVAQQPLEPLRANLAFTRRAILSAAAGTVFAWSNAAAPAATTKMLRVGYVGVQARDAPLYRAFEARMAELGYHEGRNFVFEYVQTPSIEGYPASYAELIGRKVDIILSAGSEPALRAAQAVSGGLPIVFLAIDFDPLEKGYVASLARPGGNITGIFVQQLELARKRVELVRGFLPKAKVLGLFWDAASREQADAAAEAARAAGLAPRLIEVTGQPPDYARAFAQMADVPGEPVAIPASAIFLRDRTAIDQLSREGRQPTVAAFRENAAAGALMSYGADLLDLFHDIANVVDRVAKGAKPADLPIEPPAHFHLAINLKAAALFGFAVPAAILARADEVIE
jgi:putative tryptophan/tyrosine transport system substrate-binding protein